MGEEQAGQILRFEGSDLSTVRRSVRLRVSPKAWATVENVGLTVNDNGGGDSAVARVGRRRPTSDYDDLGYVESNSPAHTQSRAAPLQRG